LNPTYSSPGPSPNRCCRAPTAASPRSNHPPAGSARYRSPPTQAREPPTRPPQTGGSNQPPDRSTASRSRSPFPLRAAQSAARDRNDRRRRRERRGRDPRHQRRALDQRQLRGALEHCPPRRDQPSGRHALRRRARGGNPRRAVLRRELEHGVEHPLRRRPGGGLARPGPVATTTYRVVPCNLRRRALSRVSRDDSLSAATTPRCSKGLPGRPLRASRRGMRERAESARPAPRDDCSPLARA
jgi:hypothetical protein